MAQAETVETRMEQNSGVFSNIITISPFNIPNILDTLKQFSVGAKTEFAKLRQLNLTYYKTLSPVYFKELNKTYFLLNCKNEEHDHVHDDQCREGQIPEISLEFAHIYRQLTIEYLHLIFMFPGFCENRPIIVINSLKSILGHIRKLDICTCNGFNVEEDNVPLMKLFQNFNGLLGNLKVLDLRYWHYSQEGSFSGLLSALPIHIQVNLWFEEVKNCAKLIQDIQQCGRQNVSIFISEVQFTSHSTLKAFCQTSTIGKLDPNIDKVELYLDTDELLAISSSTSDFLDQISHSRKLIFKNLVLLSQMYNPNTYPIPNFLLLPGIWKEQVSKLEIYSYKCPILFLREFPNLISLTLKADDMEPCLFSNQNKTDKENLTAVFEGLSNVNVLLIYDPRLILRFADVVKKILPGNALANFINELVRKLEFDGYYPKKRFWEKDAE